MFRLLKSILTFALTLILVTDVMAQATVDYLRDVKPILRERCYSCHGALKQESGLRLDTGRAVRRGGDGGAIVDAEAAESSSLTERISSHDESERMPPEGEPLTAVQIETLRNWIGQGAISPEDELPELDPDQHWAFQPPLRPDLPVTGDSESSRNPIDAFVEAKLHEHGLTAQSEAPKQVLLRRL